jgi:cysteine synthase A
VVKLEGHNPTGSMKDRMARAVVLAAEADGRLPPGGTVVEYTGGSTGASLALVAAVCGYRLTLVTSDAFSEDKLAQMAAFGADLTVIPSPGRVITKALIERMVDTARGLGGAPGSFWVDQLTNGDSVAGYHPMGEELWRQAGGRVDAFVQSVGTAASLRGVGMVLRRRDAAVRIVAVEPGESAVLSGGPPGAHRIEGIGIGYRPPMWDADLVDGIEPVHTGDAEVMARRLAREEGLFTGTSSGANVVAAIRVGRRLGPGATVATLLIDSGLKYGQSGLHRRPAPG